MAPRRRVACKSAAPNCPVERPPPTCPARSASYKRQRTRGSGVAWVRCRLRLQPKVGEARVVVRAAAQWPMKLPLGLADREVVDAGQAPLHEPVRVKLPVLVPVRPEPVARVVAPLVGEPNGDAVAGARPQLFDEPVVEFLVPLPNQELHDGGPPLEELRAVPPDAVRGVGQGDP